ncbi:hypothetical protein CBA19CS22_17955 [Caballeronia novacaledonica]|uniref:Uncharacterized protein n=1 Tax=Caballeronia novacaledonica TaxID=1544861 RepID=A0ACB5QTF9_9BURK|nr:hypothetical protein CBA19CS22_17955 [Caballeronia novacaledonica]
MTQVGFFERRDAAGREFPIQNRAPDLRHAVHAFLLELGISLSIGNAVIRRLRAALAEHSLPPRLVAILERPHTHFKYLEQQIEELDREIAHQLADDDLGRRLLTILPAAVILPPR